MDKTVFVVLVSRWYVTDLSATPTTFVGGVFVSKDDADKVVAIYAGASQGTLQQWLYRAWITEAPLNMSLPAPMDNVLV